MDPLTHTLVGASLAATRLREKTRLATPALVIGANLPDIDVFAYFAGDDFALGFRRGWTHGIPALLVLPAVLAALLTLWGRWQARSNGESRALSPGWILALCYLACLTHPALDWLNTYGMRWWMPFRDTWFYGDSVFIVDPYLWLILGFGWALGRSPARALSITVVVIAALLITALGFMAPTYLPIVGSVLVILVLAYFWPAQRLWRRAHRIAAMGLLLGTLYIGFMVSLHAFTVSTTRAELQQQHIGPIEALLVGPTPANPLAWDIVVDTGNAFRWGRYDWRYGSLVMSQARLPAARSQPIWNEITNSGQSRGFLRWVRFPWGEVESDGGTRRVHLMDARYTRSRTRGFGGTSIDLPGD